MMSLEWYRMMLSFSFTYHTCMSFASSFDPCMFGQVSLLKWSEELDIFNDFQVFIYGNKVASKKKKSKERTQRISCIVRNLNLNLKD